MSQAQITVGDELVPDVTLPTEMLDMELQMVNSQMRVSVVDMTARPCPPDVDFHTIIFDCSAWSFVDSMGVKVLSGVSWNIERRITY